MYNKNMAEYFINVCHHGVCQSTPVTKLELRSAVGLHVIGTRDYPAEVGYKGDPLGGGTIELTSVILQDGVVVRSDSSVRVPLCDLDVKPVCVYSASGGSSISVRKR
jgi:hypothetical protein